MTEKADKARQLMERLEVLRAEEPVLWAIVRGATSPLKIGLMTGLGPKTVEEQVTSLKKAGSIINYMDRALLINRKGKDYESLAEAAKFAGLIEARWITLGDADALSELTGVLSKAGREVVKGAAKAEQRAKRLEEKTTLTEKQQEVWDAIWGWMDEQGRSGEPFTTREAAKAQGYDKPGFTKNLMLALVKKGRVRYIEGRPEKWVLIE